MSYGAELASEPTRTAGHASPERVLVLPDHYIDQSVFPRRQTRSDPDEHTTRGNGVLFQRSQAPVRHSSSLVGLTVLQATSFFVCSSLSTINSRSAEGAAVSHDPTVSW